MPAHRFGHGQAGQAPAQRGRVVDLAVDRRGVEERLRRPGELALLDPHQPGQEQVRGHPFLVPGGQARLVTRLGVRLSQAEAAARGVAEHRADELRLGQLGQVTGPAMAL